MKLVPEIAVIELNVSKTMQTKNITELDNYTIKSILILFN